jgi:DNA-binding NarL/FixJ family response regulator
MAGAARIRVLLADDDAAFLEALASAMEADGRFEVVGFASNGEEAYRLGRRQEPDVVVLDVEMPVLGGVGAALRLRESTPRTCVLMVSGADEVIAHRAAAGAADAFVSKSEFDRIPDVVAELAEARRRAES